MKRTSLYLSFIIGMTVLAAPLNGARAQLLESLGGQGSASEIGATMVPEKPGPNQLVSVSIQNYSTDLNRAEISWYLNNALQKEAIGLKTFSFKTGRPGEPSVVLVVIKTAEGNVLQKSLTVHPESVDLVWETGSYAPPFYKGKPLYSYQGKVRVIALPDFVTEDGAALDPNTLVYTWQQDDKTAGDASGYGKNSFIFRGDIPIKPTIVGVDVSSFDKKYLAHGEISLTPLQPIALLYENSPLYGLLTNRALGDGASLKGGEIGVAAVPYFMDIFNRNDFNLKYEWTMNNLPISAGGSKSNLVFRQPQGSSGTALISVQASNSRKIFQFASNSFNLAFGAKPASFGF